MKKFDKKLMVILIISSLILLTASLEALINAKSVEAFNSYKFIYPEANGSDFLNYVLVNYIFNIIEPIIISLFLFLTYKNLRPNKLYSIVFGGMTIIRLVNMVLTFNLNSIFYYLLIFLYIMLLIAIIRYGNSREDRR